MAQNDHNCSRKKPLTEFGKSERRDRGNHSSAYEASHKTIRRTKVAGSAQRRLDGTTICLCMQFGLFSLCFTVFGFSFFFLTAYGKAITLNNAQVTEFGHVFTFGSMKRGHTTNMIFCVLYLDCFGRISMIDK